MVGLLSQVRGACRWRANPTLAGEMQHVGGMATAAAAAVAWLQPLGQAGQQTPGSATAAEAAPGGSGRPRKKTRRETSEKSHNEKQALARRGEREREPGQGQAAPDGLVPDVSAFQPR